MQYLKKLFWFYLWLMAFVLYGIISYCDRLAWRLLRLDKKTRYVRMGACQQSGGCCQTLGIEMPDSWTRRPKVVRLVQAWYRNVHNFQPAGDPQGRLLPLSCGYLRGKSLCSIYPYRPKLCRDYPALSFFGKIELHRGCGFWFLERDKLGSFEEKLAEKAHEQATLSST